MHLLWSVFLIGHYSSIATCKDLQLWTRSASWVNSSEAWIQVFTLDLCGHKIAHSVRSPFGLGEIMKVRLLFLALLSVALLATPAFADTLTMGTVLPHYGIVSVGSHAYLNANTGPIQGPVLVGYGSKTTSSGGNNGSVIGGVFVSGTEQSGSDNLTH